MALVSVESAAEHDNNVMSLQQEPSVHRSTCTCAYQPFRGICVKLMKCVRCSQGIMHEKECVCVSVRVCMGSHLGGCGDFSLKVFRFLDEE